MSKSDQIYEKIKIEMSNLPGYPSHLDMIPFRKVGHQHIQDLVEYRRSAVLILLYQHQDNVYSVLTERQTYEGKHSGQMSFPGGKKEEFDHDLMDTSIRETLEEIGVPVE